MPNFQSRQVRAGLPAKSALDASSLVFVHGDYTVKTGDAINDIVEMGAIPAGCVPVDVVVHTGALGASATLDVGVLAGNYGDAGTRAMGNEFAAAAAAATAVVIRSTKSLAALAATDNDRGWGVKFLGANPAAGQVVRATLICRPQG
jgi:hypothetical protein